MVNNTEWSIFIYHKEKYGRYSEIVRLHVLPEQREALFEGKMYTLLEAKIKNMLKNVLIVFRESKSSGGYEK